MEIHILYMSIDAFLQPRQQWLLFLPWSCCDNSMLPIVFWFLFCCRSCCAMTGLSAKILSSAAKNRRLTPWGLNMQQWNNRNTKWSKQSHVTSFWVLSTTSFISQVVRITRSFWSQHKSFLTFQTGIYIKIAQCLN